MNRIDLNNYEAYFLDYHEGHLDSEGKQEVKAFLADNPDLFDEFEDFGNVILPVPEINYPDKTELFRSDVLVPEADEWEFRCIAYLEGDLSEEEARSFEKEKESDPEKEKALTLFMATKSVPDETVQYENKSNLKKKAVLIPRWIYGSVAAAAILVLGWILINPILDNASMNRMAEERKSHIIYFDKLSHPEKFEKIASSESGPESLRNSTFRVNQPEVPSEEIIIYPDVEERDHIVMASIGTNIPQSVDPGLSYIPPSSSQLAYRFIPDVSDNEYQTIWAFSGDLLRKEVLGQDPELVKKTKFSFWELADAGLEKISNIFGTNADIEREYNESGELLAVSFESPLLGINTPVRRRGQAQID